MIFVLSCMVSTVDVQTLGRIFTQLPPEKQKQLSALRSDTQRRHSLAAYSLLERAAVSGCVVPPLCSLCWTTYGKPFFLNNPIAFSLSHAGDLAVCALSDVPIGIDVEPLSQSLSDWKQLANIMGFCDIQNQLQFLRTWVMWESYRKQTGTPARPADTFRTTPLSNGFLVCENGHILPLFCRMCHAFSGYAAALCLPLSHKNQPVLFLNEE